MKATALKLGNTALTLDWSNLYIRSSLEFSEIEHAWNHLKTTLQSSKHIGFYNAPIEDNLSQLLACQSLFEKLQQYPFTDCLILGIGGSFLGPYSLIQALSQPENRLKKLHFLDNPDSRAWRNTIIELNPATTLVCSITKSGHTFETIALTLLALEWLGPQRIKSNFVAITDAHQGDLRAFVTKNQLNALPIAQSIGGRFSIFSPVGLFPCLLSGLNAKAFLEGAAHMREYMEKTDPLKNPLFILAAYFVNHIHKRPIHVCMPYTTSLQDFSKWFIQLWAESLGKNQKGFTPVAALGSVDQHSILQLLSDGPLDKILFFITINTLDFDVKLPSIDKVFQNLEAKYFNSFSILEGLSLNELLRIEQKATITALTRLNKPNFSIQLDRLDEKSLGALYFFFSVLTAITGTLLEIDPYSQPGVENTKKLIHQSLTDYQQKFQSESL